MNEPLQGLLKSLTGARDALVAGTCTAQALVQAAIDVTRERNPDINAFVSVDEVAALDAAQQADERRAGGRPLSVWDGIPMGVKDNIDVAGFPTSNGIVKEGVAHNDADCMRPWREAGFVVLGKLNMHEAALGTTTENPHFGNTCNPLDTRYSAGGSSGGSAAAVAAGMVPLALGSDTMGSVRLPAANCALVGWKPEQRGQSLRGVFVLHPDLDAVGPLVNTVEDLRHALDVLGVPEPASPCDDAFEFSVLEDFAADQWDSHVREHWQHFRQTVDCAAVTLNGFAPTPVRRALLLDIETRLHDALTPAMRDEASPALKNMLEFGARVSAAQASSARALAADAREKWLALLSRIDVLVTPATPVPPTALGVAGVPHHADLLLAANLAGCPAAVMPLGVTASGLPLGLHLMTRAGRERRLLDAMVYLQRELTANR